MRREDGTVVHECIAEPAAAAEWTESVGRVQVACRVDEGRRLLHARLHSAGHLLDAAVVAAGLRGWEPTKGYHFEDGPYVEYALDSESKEHAKAEKASIVSALQTEAERLIEAGGEVSCRIDADGTRYVELGGEECPCGGTHVKDISQLGRLGVKKIKLKKSSARVSYDLSEA